MNKYKEQCAYIQIQQAKQGPKQEDQNATYDMSWRPCIVLLNRVTKETIRAISFIKIH